MNRADVSDSDPAVRGYFVVTDGWQAVLRSPSGLVLLGVLTFLVGPGRSPTESPKQSFEPAKAEYEFASTTFCCAHVSWSGWPVGWNGVRDSPGRIGRNHHAKAHLRTLQLAGTQSLPGAEAKLGLRRGPATEGFNQCRERIPGRPTEELLGTSRSDLLAANHDASQVR